MRPVYLLKKTIKKRPLVSEALLLATILFIGLLPFLEHLNLIAGGQVTNYRLE